MKSSLVGTAITAALAAVSLTGCGSNGSADHASVQSSPGTRPSSSTSASKSAAPSVAGGGKVLKPGSGGRIGKTDLELQIEKALTPKSHAYVPIAQCGHGLSGPVGSTVRCRITVPGGQLWAKATVTHVYGDGVAYKLGHAAAPSAR